MSIVGRLYEVAGHDWRTGHLAHTSDTAKEAADIIERLVGALRPFARYASQHAAADLPDEIGLAYIPTCGMPQLTMKDCREARAALKAVKEDK